jgi:hypothetical protein
MVRIGGVLAGLFVLAAASAALAQGGADNLAGNWTVTWDNNPKNKNTMSFTNQGGRFSGTYQNDNKDSCSITGNFQASGQKVAFQIVCPNWDIRMQGIVATNSNTIGGTYQAYIDLSGKFSMAKQ